MLYSAVTTHDDDEEGGRKNDLTETVQQLINPLVSSHDVRNGDGADMESRDVRLSMSPEELQIHYDKVMRDTTAEQQRLDGNLNGATATIPPLLFLSKLAQWFDVPLSPHLFFTIRGAENFHIYLWIAKDLAWCQGNFTNAIGFGLAALAWCGVLMYHAVHLRNYEEIYFMFPLTLWLFANFWWMTSDFVVHGGDGDRELQAGYIMFAGLAFFALYWILLRPINALTTNVNTARKYNDVGLQPRWSLFRSWRQYEHFHTLCWLGKDIAWNHFSFIPWLIFAVPTIYISLDFVWMASRNKGLAIDSAHYLAQLMWVSSNLVWALGEIYLEKLDVAYDLFDL